MLIATPVVVGAAILVGLLAANIIPFESSPSPSPSGAASSPSIGPSGAPSTSPSALPSLAAQYPACDDVDETVSLALRVEKIGNTGREWVISVYEDGHVLTPGLTWGDSAGDANDGAWMLARRLTPGGVRQLHEAVMATGLFGESGNYNPVPLPNVEPPGRGGSGYAITVGSGSDAVAVTWTSMFPDDAVYYEPSPEREELDVLGAKMMVFETWLPDDAWAERDPCPVQALRFRVYIDAQPWGGALGDLPPDMQAAPWPLGGEILSWAADVGYQPPDEPYHVERCGIVPRSDAGRLVDELRDAGGVDPFTFATTLDAGPYVSLALGDRAAIRIIQIFVQPLLPDDTRCGRDNHPTGGGI